MEIKSKDYMNLQKITKKEDVKNRREDIKLETSVKLESGSYEEVVNIKDKIENETVLNGEDAKILLNGKRFQQKDDNVKEAVEILNKLLRKRGSKVEIRNHDFFKNDRMIKIVDEKTGDVIVEVPPKKILDMIASLVKIAEGIVIDQKV